jgi:hypothetical protein
VKGPAAAPQQQVKGPAAAPQQQVKGPAATEIDGRQLRCEMAKQTQPNKPRKFYAERDGRGDRDRVGGGGSWGYRGRSLSRSHDRDRRDDYRRRSPDRWDGRRDDRRDDRRDRSRSRSLPPKRHASVPLSSVLMHVCGEAAGAAQAQATRPVVLARGDGPPPFPLYP